MTVKPSVDSVQEFKVITSSYDAEYGNAAGGVVQFQTKAGTNQFHGDAYEFYRPNSLTARPYAFGGSKNPGEPLARMILRNPLLQRHITEHSIRNSLISTHTC